MKKIPAQKFAPAIDALMRERNRLNQEELTDEGDRLRDMIHELIPLVNQDTCVTKRQWTESIDALRELKVIKYHFDPSIDLIDSSLERSQRRVEVKIGIMSVASYINSLRNECHNCLREVCPYRDPSTNAEEVEGRLGEDEVIANSRYDYKNKQSMWD